MDHEAKMELVRLLATQASNAPVLGPQGYFRSLVQRVDLPPAFVQSIAFTFSGIPAVDAQSLVDWALAKGVNPKSPGFTTLGMVLRPILDNQEVGLAELRFLASLIVTQRLFNEQSDSGKKALDQIIVQYQVPRLAAAREQPAAAYGPDIQWSGPTDRVELQGWMKPAPPMYDVGFLRLAIARAACICRVEMPGGRSGTGFLIAKDLVMTNYHVVKVSQNDSLESDAKNVKLRFGQIAGDPRQNAVLQLFNLADKPIVSASAVAQLDYVLLRVEPRVKDEPGIEVAPLNDSTPAAGDGLNLLQHPLGGPMQVSLSCDGITKVLPQSARVQYVTSAAGGSSGSPCFDADWNVIALHHAERSQGFGTIREGILLSDILKEIKQYL